MYSNYILRQSYFEHYLFIVKVAGGNGAGSSSAQLYNPWGIYVDVNGSMYIVDQSNHRVQLWYPGEYGK